MTVNFTIKLLLVCYVTNILVLRDLNCLPTSAEEASPALVVCVLTTGARPQRGVYGYIGQKIGSSTHCRLRDGVATNQLYPAFR